MGGKFHLPSGIATIGGRSKLSYVLVKYGQKLKLSSAVASIRVKKQTIFC
jgi:hypothetical protein